MIEGLLEEGEKVEAAHLGHDVAAEVRLEMEARMHACIHIYCRIMDMTWLRA